MIPHTHTCTHTLTKSDCYSWSAVPGSSHQGPWHTKALCHLSCRCSLLLPARQPASPQMPLTRPPSRPSTPQHSGWDANTTPTTSTDIPQPLDAARQTAHTHIQYKYTHTHTHTQCMDTYVQCEYSYKKSSTLVWPSHRPAQFFVIVVRRETDSMTYFCSWKTRKRRELRCSVTNLCTFSYCHYERHSPRWQELIIYIYIYICLLGFPSPTACANRHRKEIM